jgi:hypothetical protein
MHGSNRKKESVFGTNRNNLVADEVMAEIATDMDLNNSSDVRKLRKKMGAKYRNSGEKEEEENETERVPHDLFTRSMTNSSTLQTYPVSLNTAIKSLRFAIQHPLTNHDEVPASSLFPGKHYNQKTQLSENRQLPRLDNGIPIKITDLDEKMRLHQQKKKDAESTLQDEEDEFNGKKNMKKKLPRPIVSEQKTRPNKRNSNGKPFLETVNDKKKVYSHDKRAQNNAALQSTMKQIDDVLDELNKNTLEISQRSGHGSVFKGTSRPTTTGVKGLIDMVNNVVDELAR